MSTFPDALYKRLQNTVAQCKRRADSAHQRLNTMGSQVNSLQPGDWNLLELNSGWSSTSGFIPAQSRLHQQGVTWLVGHIEGGEVADGTVIGALSPGYFNATHSHSFTANVVAGANAVPVAGTLAGDSDETGLSDGTINGTSDTTGLPDGTVGGTSAATTATTGVSHTHGGGSFAIGDGQHAHSGGSFAVTNGQHAHGSSALAATTHVNYNTALLTIDPSGNVTLSNCPAAASQISFSEFLPLNTS